MASRFVRNPWRFARIFWTFCEFPRITSTPTGPSQTSPHGGQIMRTSRFVAFTTVLLLVALALAVTAAAADQHSRTLKKKPDKSQYRPRPPPNNTTTKSPTHAQGRKVN